VNKWILQPLGDVKGQKKTVRNVHQTESVQGCANPGSWGVGGITLLIEKRGTNGCYTKKIEKRPWKTGIEREKNVSPSREWQPRKRNWKGKNLKGRRS